MLGLKNPFTKSETPTEPPGPSETSPLGVAVKAQKRWQLEQGRTRARVDALSGEVVVAQGAEEVATKVLGSIREDGRDTSAALKEWREANDRVREVQAALAGATRKDHAALAELATANRLVTVETEFAALAQLKLVVAPKLDQLCAELTRLLTDELFPALDAARVASGSDIRANFVTAAKLGVAEGLRNASCGLIPAQTVYSVLYKDKSVADYIPDPETARTRKRDGQR